MLSKHRHSYQGKVLVLTHEKTEKASLLCQKNSPIKLYVFMTICCKKRGLWKTVICAMEVVSCSHGLGLTRKLSDVFALRSLANGIMYLGFLCNLYSNNAILTVTYRKEERTKPHEQTTRV